MNSYILFKYKFSIFMYVTVFSQVLALVSASPSAADIKSPAKKTEIGYIYFPGTSFEEDAFFHIEALKHDVEVIADSESPVGIERVLVFTPLEFWYEKYRESWEEKYRIASDTFSKKPDVDIKVKRMFDQCAWKVGGSLRASDVVSIMSIVPVIKHKTFDVVKYNVMYRDDFGEMSFYGTQASFKSETAPHVFSMNSGFGSSYKSRGKFYIFVRQVLFSDGTVWEADYKGIVGEFEFPVRQETPIESMVKKIVPEEKRIGVSEKNKPMVQFSGAQLIINEGCDPWFHKKN
jgi:hypothetical protein